MEVQFPYSPRPGQTEIVDALSAKVREGVHCVMQSGTGTGKTVCALSSTLSVAEGSDLKVLYLTRTNSQQRQVMAELRSISRISPIFGVAIQGRRNLCPYVDINDELKSGTHEELSLLCGQKKARVLSGDAAACKFYHALISTDISPIESWARRTLPTAEEFALHCSERGLCPYEMLKRLAEGAKVVTAPYIYFFDPFIRRSLLDWMGCRIGDLIVIVDESHNLPEYARELRTAELSLKSLKAAEREANDLNDPEVIEGTSTIDFLGFVEKTLEESISEFVLEEDGLVPQAHLEEQLMASCRVTSRAILRAASELVNLGNIIRDKRKKEGRLPRSHLYAAGAFLASWMALDDEQYVKLVVAGENPMFQAYCMDPSVACGCLQETSSSVHMSGTLDPLEEYRDSIGLPKESAMLSFPSPFPRENLGIVHVGDVTSKYEDVARDCSNLEKMKGHIAEIIASSTRNIAVFFPSYNMLEAFSSDEPLSNCARRVFKEERGMPQDDLMDIVTKFKGSRDGAIMLAVSGGRISEGIDFPDKELEIAVIAGIPYPKPTARTRALQHFYEIKFGKGWDYVVKAPTTRKILQSIGRLIRSETDRGLAVILDKRAVHFLPYIDSEVTKDLEKTVRDFFPIVK